MKKIIIFGANGFIGNELIDFYLKQNDQVLGISRKPIKKNNENFISLLWDGKNLDTWSKALESADVVLNLTGKSVDCRYTNDNKSEIYQSRINAVNVIAKAIQKCENPPKLWINFASATIYMHRFEANDEYEGIIGTGFSVDVCKKWEEAFYTSNCTNTRKVNFRTAIVMGKNGGVFPVLTKLCKFGLGGKMGNGKQFLSWIHIKDLCQATEFIVENEQLMGTFNLAAPNPLENKKAQEIIRKANRKYFHFPQPKFLLEIGARIIKTETELILKSRFVIPKRLIEEKFKFQFTHFDDCVENLTKQSQ